MNTCSYRSVKMDAIEQLFQRKTIEASNLIKASDKLTNTAELPFEVNKVLYKINEETERRKKLFKRKQEK